MAEIWIKEEEITDKSLDYLGHFIRLDGEIKRIYFIGAGTDGGDYVDENMHFSRDFLIVQNRYPLYLTFIVYDEQTEEYSALLKKNKIDFTLIELEEKVTYFNILGKHQYHPPCFSVIITDTDSLSLVLEETFGSRLKMNFTLFPTQTT